MTQSPFDPKFCDLPEVIPIFPLDGVLLLPRGELPLNIFEPRYLSMVDTAMKGNRLIGMIQPHFGTGCVGRIIRFEETTDGRYLISLRGVCRFRLKAEQPSAPQGYRMSAVTWAGFDSDMTPVECLNLDKFRLKTLLRSYFESQGLSMDWDLMDDVADEGLITTLSMVCPLPPQEKQALLEAGCCRARADLFIKLLEMAVTPCCSAASTNRPH